MSAMAASKIERWANQMRRKMTPAESRLHNALLAALFPFNAQVKAQEVVGYYIADFMIYPARVVVECDGAHHKSKHGEAYDRRRDTTMRRAGIRTIRFENWRIYKQLPQVIAEILAFCGDFHPKPLTTPLGAPIVRKLPTVYGRRLRSRRWSESQFRRIP
jgi:very-short-patch-repair endonuclease